jgi:hypothetical protein
MRKLCFIERSLQFSKFMHKSLGNLFSPSPLWHLFRSTNGTSSWGIFPLPPFLCSASGPAAPAEEEWRGLEQSGSGVRRAAARHGSARRKAGGSVWGARRATAARRGARAAAEQSGRERAAPSGGAAGGVGVRLGLGASVGARTVQARGRRGSRHWRGALERWRCELARGSARQGQHPCRARQGPTMPGDARGGASKGQRCPQWRWRLLSRDENPIYRPALMRAGTGRRQAAHARCRGWAVAGKGGRELARS